MADYDVPAAVEESAKAIQSVSETSRVFGGYLAAIVGEAPKTAMNIIDDRLKMFRAKKVIGYYAEAKKLLQDAGLDPNELLLPSPSIELPLLQAATLEDREELCRLWEQLLAAAMTPAFRDRVRAKHIQVLKALEPLDARLLSELEAMLRRTPTDSSNTPSGGAFKGLARELLHASPYEIDISLDSLEELRLIHQSPGMAPAVTSFGRTFLEVVSVFERKT